MHLCDEDINYQMCFLWSALLWRPDGWQQNRMHFLKWNNHTWFYPCENRIHHVFLPVRMELCQTICKNHTSTRQLGMFSLICKMQKYGTVLANLHNLNALVVLFFHSCMCFWLNIALVQPQCNYFNTYFQYNIFAIPIYLHCIPPSCILAILYKGMHQNDKEEKNFFIQKHVLRDSPCTKSSSEWHNGE